ncbi:MAG: DUF4350 domain-containing protein [Gemmatimonadales bacterium]
MQPRTSTALGLGALAALVAIGAALGRRGNRELQQDLRPSSYLAGPSGVRGLADALTRFGVKVERSRRPLRTLVGDMDGTSRTAVVILNPEMELDGGAIQLLAEWSARPGGPDLVLAGSQAAPLMHCFGFGVDFGRFERYAIRTSVPDESWPELHSLLASRGDTVVADSSRLSDASISSCRVIAARTIDTLLVTRSGRVVALRIHRADREASVTLLSDPVLLENRAVRETASGPFAVRLFVGRYDRVIFEERLHGFGEEGSLLNATLEWSRQSPWGWGAWQLAIVGLLALAAGAVRFGPIRPAIARARRSSLEHVRALATALAAARGHDVAIGAMIRGLRRRLLPAGQRPQGDWLAWLSHLVANTQRARARDAAQTLMNLTRPGQPPDGVLRAANAVEDVWEELHP